MSADQTSHENYALSGSLAVLWYVLSARLQDRPSSRILAAGWDFRTHRGPTFRLHILAAGTGMSQRDYFAQPITTNHHDGARRVPDNQRITMQRIAISNYPKHITGER